LEEVQGEQEEATTMTIRRRTTTITIQGALASHAHHNYSEET
jgi:hypothetical protein